MIEWVPIKEMALSTKENILVCIENTDGTKEIADASYCYASQKIIVREGLTFRALPPFEQYTSNGRVTGLKLTSAAHLNYPKNLADKVNDLLRERNSGPDGIMLAQAILNIVKEYYKGK